VSARESARASERASERERARAARAREKESERERERERERENATCAGVCLRGGLHIPERCCIPPHERKHRARQRGVRQHCVILRVREPSAPERLDARVVLWTASGVERARAQAQAQAQGQARIIPDPRAALILLNTNPWMLRHPAYSKKQGQPIEQVHTTAFLSRCTWTGGDDPHTQRCQKLLVAGPYAQGNRGHPIWVRPCLPLCCSATGQIEPVAAARTHSTTNPCERSAKCPFSQLRQLCLHLAREGQAGRESLGGRVFPAPTMPCWQPVEADRVRKPSVAGSAHVKTGNTIRRTLGRTEGE